MIVTTNGLFKHAYGKYAIGAYNINNLEQCMGLFQGNLQSKAPFIIQISKGARSYTHKKMLESMLKTADEIFPDSVFAIHLDHGDEATCMDCIASGIYSSVMIDASHEPLAKNIEITKRVVDAAHAKGLSVEAELGVLSGIEEDVKAAEHVYTKPDEAVQFVKATGCDSLACAIGTSHGAFKFKGSQSLRFDILDDIQKLMPGFPLVMHGSSSVPEDEVRRINFFGGAMKGASGVDENSFLKAGKLGVTKINIDTDGRLVWTRVHREYFALYPENFDLRPVGKVFMAEYARFIAAKNKKLGSAGQLDAVREFCKAKK
jgi:fructose-bisphosphate aldolase class II